MRKVYSAVTMVKMADTEVLFDDIQFHDRNGR